MDDRIMQVIGAFGFILGGLVVRAKAMEYTEATVDRYNQDVAAHQAKKNKSQLS